MCSRISLTRSRLQPSVLRAAILWSRQQPYVLQAAAPCAPGCNPMPSDLQPYVTQAFELMQRENDQLRRRLHELEASG